jgi:apolipoprotein N-acyltransferase
VPTGLWLARAPLGRPRTARQGWGLGYATGLVFYGGALHWIALLSKVAVTVSWIMYPAWLAAAAYLALYPALAGALTAWARRALGLPVAIGWPLFYLAADGLRALGELGFPWLHLGYSQWNVLPVLQLASLSGVSAVSLWVGVLNALALALLVPRLGWTRGAGVPSRRTTLALATALVAVLAAPFLAWGLAPPAVRPDTVKVGLVQGNVPGAVKWSGKDEDATLDKFFALTRRAIALGARFVVWPETATGAYLRQNPEQRLRLQDFVDETEVPVLAGYPDYRFTGPRTYLSWNAAGVFWPRTGLGPQYAKMHLVPFGERMPFETVLPALGKIELGQAEWTPGIDPSPLPTPLGPAGVIVCFESIFTDPARAEVLRGASWLVVITNDEWFGRSAALAQHASMSVFRAVEHHVPLARCANTGLTFLIDPYGRITRPAPAFEDAVVVEPLVRARGGPTPFTRAGDTVGPAILGLALIALLAALLATLRGRGALTEPTEAGKVQRSAPSRSRRRPS